MLKTLSFMYLATYAERKQKAIERERARARKRDKGKNEHFWFIRDLI